MINPLNSTNIKLINTKRLLVALSFILVSISGLPQVAGAQEASFYLSPSKGNYNVGSTFSVDVLIKPEGIAINAAQATIYFPSENLKVLEISKQNSIFSLWVEEPVFSNSEGKISFLGGLPSPGFIGEKGKVITILFKAQSAGKAEVSFSGEKILANDAFGTDVFSFSQGGTYSIVVPEEMPPVEKPKKPPEIPVKDTEPPLPFEIIIDNEGDPANPQPLLYFETTDDLSGISHYEIKIGEEDFFKVSLGETKPFRLPHLTPGIYPIIVRAFDKAGNYIDSTAEVKVESIPVPEITVCPDTYMAGEEILYIGGISLPEHTIVAFLKTDGKIIKTWEVSTDEKGEWFFEEDGLFKSGIYKISARAKNVKGAISNLSEECVLRVILGAISVGPWIISYKTLIWIFIIILIFILFVILYLLLKVKRSKRRIKRETQDLKEKFDKEYNEIELDIKRELEELKRIRGKRKINEEEKKREEGLLKNLADIKTVFEKELKDIEEIK